MKYINRIIDQEIQEKLSVMGAVLINGPKWCGKTTSSKRIAKSVLEMQNPYLRENYMELANIQPSLLLEGRKPRLIDEWQVGPNLWNAVKNMIDSVGLPNQYILTGVSSSKEDNILHSGDEKIASITMKPMTLFESGDSNGRISLTELLNGKHNIDGITTKLTYKKMAFVLCRGGWPYTLNISQKQSLEIAKGYLDELCNSDISMFDGVKRNPSLAKAILKSYAKQISTINSNKSLFKDVKENFAVVSEKTMIDYLNVLKKLYIIDEIEAWKPNIRNKTAIRTSRKKSMIDPSLAVAVLGYSPKELMLDFCTYSLLFENLVNRDLSVYVKSIGGKLKHYRDRYNLKCNNVIQLDDGRYALVETKLGGTKIKEVEKNLLTLKKLLSENNPEIGSPEFLMIITATDTAYTTENGVMVVPIGCLKN